jgi:RNA polymerase sigma factor (sigma-70 family)
MLIPWLFKETSIDDYVDGEGETRISAFLEDPRTVRPEDDLYQRQLVALAREALEDLTEREKMIIYRRFGLFGNDEMTLEQIGKVIGLSRERVRQLEKEAKMKMKQRLAPLRSQLKFSEY